MFLLRKKSIPGVILIPRSQSPPYEYIEGGGFRDALKRLHSSVSRKNKGSNNRKKAINRMQRKHLKVSRQRQDNAVKQALYVVRSNDLVTYEKLQVKNMGSWQLLVILVGEGRRQRAEGRSRKSERYN